MKTKIERNMESLWRDMENHAKGRMDEDTVTRLNLCFGAYQALSAVCAEDEAYQEHTAAAKRSSWAPKLTQADAKAWMDGLKNEDASTGPHWTMAQTKQVQDQKGSHLDPLEFWAAMNSIYSDYCAVAKKHNINSVDFYTDMACAFLEDEDASPNKLARYYECIVQHA